MLSVLSSILRGLYTASRGAISGLPEASALLDPIDLFNTWYRAAEASGLYLPEAMTLATADADGKPSARMVLLKHVDQEGFVFYTNYESRKAAELDANPQAALVCHWSTLQRQVRIEGIAARIEESASDRYFAGRPRGSRIGAWASRQSQVLPDRRTLEERVRAVEARFGGETVPRPPFWGGYRVRPDRIEFWQGKADRLHDRLLFIRSEAGWSTDRLYP